MRTCCMQPLSAAAASSLPGQQAGSRLESGGGCRTCCRTCQFAAATLLAGVGFATNVALAAAAPLLPLLTEV